MSNLCILAPGTWHEHSVSLYYEENSFWCFYKLQAIFFKYKLLKTIFQSIISKI